MSKEPVLRARNVVAGYGRRTVLDGASLELFPGELVGVVGENGAGKSTLVSVLVGLKTAAAGEVEIAGRVGYCPQSALLYPRLTVEEHFRLFAEAYGLSTWRDAMEKWCETLSFARDIKTRAERLSGGTQQKLNLALALMHEPELLLLDEPYQGFDWETYLRFWDLADALRKQGRTVLMVSHLVVERERLSRVLELKGGRLA